jgi:MSHA biogenesis protein MshQ
MSLNGQRKYPQKIRSALLGLMLVPGLVSATCSPYIGQATINEISRVNNAGGPADADDFVEIRQLDTSLTDSIIQNWSLKVCFNKAVKIKGTTTYSISCAEKPMSGASAGTSVDDYWWAYNSDTGTDGFPTAFIGFNDGFHIELLDASDALVDILVHNSKDSTYSPTTSTSASYAACPFRYDNESTSASASGQRQLRRDPDGIGDWDEPSGGSGTPTNQTTNNGTGGTGGSLPNLSITSIDATPGANAIVTFSLSAALAADLDVYYSSEDNTAISGLDYGAPNPTSITVPAGTTTVNVAVPILATATPATYFYLWLDSVAATVNIVNNRVTLTVLNPVAANCFTDDFESRTLLGPDWAVSSSVGSILPSIVGGRLNITQDLNNQSTAATLFRLFPSSGNKIVVEFDYYAYGDLTGGADGLALVFSDATIVPLPGGYGGSLGYAPKNSIEGFAGGWMGIGLDEYGNFLNFNDGAKSGGFPNLVRETITIRGSGTGTSGYNYITSNGQIPSTLTLPSSLSPPISTASGHRYRVTVDHQNGTNAYVTVERDTGAGFATLVSQFDLLAQTGQAPIPEKMYLTLTGSTGGAKNAHEIDNIEVCANAIEPAETIDHYELDRDFSQGLTCEALNIESRACLDVACSTEVGGAVITTEFSPVTGWAGSNTKTNYSSQDSFAFQQTSPGTVTLGVASSIPDLKPLSTEPVQCYVAGIVQPDCEVPFADTGLRFFNRGSGSSSAILDLVAGQPSEFDLRAIYTDETSGECKTQLFDSGPVTATLSTECTNPDTCLAGQQVFWQAPAESLNLANPQNPDGGNLWSSAALLFGTNVTAGFELTAPDVGLQRLDVSLPLLNVDGSPSGRLIEGSVSLRTRPASLVIAAVDISGTAIAGDPFQVTMHALDANNNVLPSFGRVSGLYDMNWGLSSLAAPIGGVLGTLVGDAVNSSSASQWLGLDTGIDADSFNESITFSAANGLSYYEVGELNLVAQIDDYLGSGVPVQSPNTPAGRFIPAFLTATQVYPATWGSDASIYQGQAGSLTDLSYDLTAYASDGTTPLLNYSGNGLNTSSQSNSLLKPVGAAATGGDLESTLTWTLTGGGDFDGIIRLMGAVPDLTWQRNPVGVSPSDTLLNLTDLQLAAAALTDSDAVCVRLNALGTCLATAVSLTPRDLQLVRAALPAQVDANTSIAYIEVRLEALDRYVAGEAVFELQSTDNSLDSSVFAGLNFDASVHACTLATSADCPSIAATASFTGPNGMGLTLMSGVGRLTATSTTPVSGLMGAQLNAPTWLSWDWDGDGDQELASTVLIFGDYQGRPPLLFTRPGVR